MENKGSRCAGAPVGAHGIDGNKYQKVISKDWDENVKLAATKKFQEYSTKKLRLQFAKVAFMTKDFKLVDGKLTKQRVAKVSRRNLIKYLVYNLDTITKAYGNKKTYLK